MDVNAVQMFHCTNQDMFLSYLEQFSEAVKTNTPAENSILFIYDGPRNKQEAKSWKPTLSDAVSAYVSAGAFSFTLTYMPKISGCALASGVVGAENLDAWLKNRAGAKATLKELGIK